MTVPGLYLKSLLLRSTLVSGTLSPLGHRQACLSSKWRGLRVRGEAYNDVQNTESFHSTGYVFVSAGDKFFTCVHDLFRMVVTFALRYLFT